MRIIKALLAVCMIFMLTGAKGGENQKIENIAILGDSIAYGYGLSENEKNYGEWLGDFYKAEVENLGAVGETTGELLERLEKDDGCIKAVERAQLVCISVGANDVLDVFYGDLMEILRKHEALGFEDMSGAGNEITEILEELLPEFIDAACTAGDNISLIENKIKEINPDAEIVILTVYNPFETEDNSKALAFAPLYGFTEILTEPVNSRVRESNVSCSADIEEVFKGSCPILTNIENMDIHPNGTGHLVIAGEIAGRVGQTGNGAYLKRAFYQMISEGKGQVSQNTEDIFNMLVAGNFEYFEREPETALVEETEKGTSAQTKEGKIKDEQVGEKNKNILFVIIPGAAVLIAVVLIKIKRNEG